MKRGRDNRESTDRMELRNAGETLAEMPEYAAAEQKGHKRKKKRGKRRFLKAALVVLFALLLLTFCGDSDDDVRTGTAAPAELDNDAIKAQIAHFDNCYILNEMDEDTLDNFLAFYAAASDFKEEFDLPHPIPKTEEKKVYSLMLTVVYECPELFQLDYDDLGMFRYSSNPEEIAGCTLSYQMDKDTYLSRLEQCREIVKKLGDETAGMSDYDKECYIYNYLAENMIYDDSAEFCGSIYGALVLGKAKCVGISEAFKYACDEAGLPCISLFCYGDEENCGDGHAWNTVCIDGNWYDVDLTADVETAKRETDGLRLYPAMNVPRTWITDVHHPVATYYTDYYSIPESTSFDRDYHVVNGEFVSAGGDYAAQYRAGLTRAWKEGSGAVYLQFENTDDYDKFLDEEDAISRDWFYNDSSAGVSRLGGTLYDTRTYRTVLFAPTFS